MPVLAYCVTTAEVALKVAQTGVAGMTVESVDESGLRCFVSRRESELPMSSLATREEALAFHSVLQELFRQTTIIPFRFPTLLADEALSAHLREHAGQYRDTLARLKNMVQMEIHLGFGVAESPESLNVSGTQYLRRRQGQRRELEELAERFREAGAIRSWRKRDSARGVRCFALVQREGIADFQRQAAGVTVGSEIGVRVTGPWPPTEFLKEK
ncbi:MAG: hypothetical protein DMG73_06255 [Acidobacteria bacterium]|jgi:hypothetical protein|nr:MAG: hypothetical protein DMG73_06255 [Acidobacteriota bacterium]